MAGDPYREFARVYDEWQALYPTPFSLALSQRIRATAREWPPPEKTYADLACGTGTLAHWWQARHPSWTVYGADQSAAMIERAREAGDEHEGKLRRRLLRSYAVKRRPGSGPTFFVQNLTELDLPGPVGLATCLFDSLNHVLRQRDLARIFHSVQGNLAPRGIFLFDLLDEDDFPEAFTGASVMEGKDLYLGTDSRYFTRKGIGRGEITFTFFRREGARWERLQAVVEERCWKIEDVRPLVQAAGLEILRVDHIDPEENEEVFVPRTFWICRRS